MNAENNIKRKVRMALAAMLLALGVVSAAGAKPTSASTLPETSPINLIQGGMHNISEPVLPDASPIDDMREDMHNIAYLYANHRWTASKTNLIQYPYPDIRFNTTNGHLLEPDSTTQDKYFGDPIQQQWLSKDFMNQNKVITPDWIAIKENTKPLFSITDSSLVTTIANDLDKQTIDADLSNQFQSALGHSLGDTVPPVVEQPGNQWAIIDSNDTSYQIQFENQILNVYSGENAGSPVGENMGVPYAWGMSSGLIATAYDKALDSQMIDVSLPISQGYLATNASFDKKIAGGYFAGNQYYLVQPGNNYAAGVE